MSAKPERSMRDMPYHCLDWTAQGLPGYRVVPRVPLYGKSGDGSNHRQYSKREDRPGRGLELYVMLVSAGAQLRVNCRSTS